MSNLLVTAAISFSRCSGILRQQLASTKSPSGSLVLSRPHRALNIVRRSSLVDQILEALTVEQLRAFPTRRLHSAQALSLGNAISTE